MVAGHRQHSDQHTGCFHWWTLRILKSPNLPKHNFLKIIAQ